MEVHRAVGRVARPEDEAHGVAMLAAIEFDARLAHAARAAGLEVAAPG